MKNIMVKVAIVVAAAVFGWTAKAESASFDVHTKVGDGWHMYSTVTVNESGQISGKTTLKNYNNIKGFTGGVFAVALDADNEALYATEIHSYGINASFFRSCVERTVTWTDTVPAEYLPRVAKMAVVQVHNPSYRVWTWIYQNRDLLIAHGKAIADLFQKYQNNQLTAQDITTIINAHLNRL